MSVLYNYSPLTVLNKGGKYLSEYNDVYDTTPLNFINTYDLIATKFIAAFTDSQGNNKNLILAASSNVNIDGVDSVSMFVGNKGLVQQYASSNNAANERIDTLIMKSYLSNVQINGRGSNMTIIQSGDPSKGETAAIMLKGTDSFKSVYLNDMVAMSGYGGDDQQHLGTTHSNFRFENAIVANVIQATENLIGAKVTGESVYVTKNLFSPDINLYKDINSAIDQKINKVGYGFNINANNQLEIVKYSRFNNGASTKSISKRVAVFGNNNLNYTDTTDTSYLIFDQMGVSQSSSNGSNSSILSQSPWQVNSDKTMYYLNNFVGINIVNPKYELDVNGTIHAVTLQADNMYSSNIVSSGQHITSDERLKEMIVNMDLQSCFDSIKNLDVYQYVYKADAEKSVVTGFVAQQVEGIISNAVKTINYSGLDDCKIIDTNIILANLVGAVKVLMGKVDAMAK